MRVARGQATAGGTKLEYVLAVVTYLRPPLNKLRRRKSSAMKEGHIESPLAPMMQGASVKV